METSTAAAQSTIAYQISIFIPSMKEMHMVDVNPSTVPDKVTSQQLHYLIIKLFRERLPLQLIHPQP